MKKLYFVRHGQSEDNDAGIWSRYETRLTPAGREQARATGQNIKQKGLSFDVVIASPMPRAHETAQIIAREIGHPEDAIELLEMLIERDWGVLTGTPNADFAANHIYKDMDDFEKVERLEELQARAAAAFALLTDRPEGRILIVGHGTFGRALRRVIAGLPHTHEYRTDFPSDRIQNAEVVELM